MFLAASTEVRGHLPRFPACGSILFTHSFVHLFIHSHCTECSSCVRCLYRLQRYRKDQERPGSSSRHSRTASGGRTPCSPSPPHLWFLLGIVCWGSPCSSQGLELSCLQWAAQVPGHLSPIELPPNLPGSGSDQDFGSRDPMTMCAHPAPLYRLGHWPDALSCCPGQQSCGYSQAWSPGDSVRQQKGAP